MARAARLLLGALLCGVGQLESEDDRDTAVFRGFVLEPVKAVIVTAVSVSYVGNSTGGLSLVLSFIMNFQLGLPIRLGFQSLTVVQKTLQGSQLGDFLLVRAKALEIGAEAGFE
ncbi:hypothetical protein DUI87_17258 [Hirundo rustica rustica]|uniref:Uncharacterized protein n=1 Tax=Hirundo rustica rustica TaxID=333673 RepID=A0A3M0JY27_HIRRU|nr:hypothetical protein DUI87_17258 [Hirundo rustica rustica]